MHTRFLVGLFAVALLVLVAGCQIGAIGNSDSDDGEEPEAPAGFDGPSVVTEPTATGDGAVVIAETPGPSTPDTPTPVPPTPLPDRTNCAEIKGTQYHSPQEREWYLANCIDRTSCAEIEGTDYRSETERLWYESVCVATPTPVAGQGDAGVEPTPVPVVAAGPPPIPGPEVPGERWILVDLATQTTTAMIGTEPLYTAYATTGKDDWETPTGTYSIIYRVENETMTSESIGAEEYYVLEDVLYTQYFTVEGHALHLNYWRTDDYFGNIRSSHGCVGMRLADAEFFWNFADYGTRVTIQ